MTTVRAFGPNLAGVNPALSVALMQRLGTPWRLVSGGNIRTFLPRTAPQMADYIRGQQGAGRAVMFLPPAADGAHHFIAARIPLTASPAELTPPPQFIICSDDFTCLWRLAEPVNEAQARRMAAKLVAKQKGKPAIGEPIPLPGTMLLKEVRLRMVQRFPVSLLPPLAVQAYHFVGDIIQAAVAPASPFVDAEDVEAAPLEWVWPGLIPLGSMTLLGGAAGMGKSQAAISLAATVSKGGTWPTGEAAEKGSALVLEAEDDLARTVKPRLLAAGANLKKVGMGKVIDLRQGPGMLEAEWKRRKDLRLVVMSPIRKFIGDAEHHGNIGVRDVLQPILDWAEHRRVTLLGICHPLKGQEHKESFAGSAAFLELARAAYSVIPDPASEEPIVKQKPRIMVAAKSNLAPDSVAMSYRIEGAVVDGIATSRVVWRAK